MRENTIPLKDFAACTYFEGKFKEFSVECSDADVITAMGIGGQDSLAMVGHSYVNEKFSKIFCSLMEKEIDDFGIASMFWEDFYAKHMKD